MATALVVLDWVKRVGADLSITVPVPQSVVAIGGPNPLGLRPGDRISLRDALYATLIASDNLAAQTLAHTVGADLLRRQNRQDDPLAAFVRQMNVLAKKHGLEKTRFTNPHGLDHARPIPYSTASDMARLAIVAMRRPGFSFYVGQEQRALSYKRGGRRFEFTVKNTNRLVSREGIDGVKTGTTRRSGPCLVLSGKKAPIVETTPDGRKRITPQKLIVVVLGSGARFSLASTLLEQGWRQFGAWHNAGRPVAAHSEILTLF